MNQKIMNLNFNKLLQKTTARLSVYLEKYLPDLFDDWWDKSVVNILSYQQRRRVKEKQITSLSSLDFAALLRVLDQNWYQISNKLELTAEARHFVKEMQTVRNRWAHAGSDGFPIEDIYRDLDTLQRFAVIVEADKDLLKEIHETKVSLLSYNQSNLPSDKGNEKKQSLDTHETEFELGQIVQLKSNTKMRGAVSSILAGKPENRYLIFINGETHTYYASQLKAEGRPEPEIHSIKANKFSLKSKNVGYEIMKMGMRLLKETNGDISDKEATNELLKAFPEKTPKSLKAEMGKLRQNYNHIVGNKRSKEGVVSQIIDQLKAGEKATAGVSDSTNKYSTRAWHAFHEI